MSKNFTRLEKMLIGIIRNHTVIGQICFKKSFNLVAKQQRIRCFSISFQKLQEQPKNVAPSSGKGEVSTTFAKKAKENVKTASYSAVVIAGIGITLGVFYIVFKELFSSETPQSFFQYGSQQCINHEKVQDLLGEPIKAAGIETRRHKSKQVKHMYYQDEQGKKGLRIQFDLYGFRRHAIGELDAREDESGTMKTRYIIVTTDDMHRKSVIVEDNR